jgi:hypothetical protein
MLNLTNIETEDGFYETDLSELEGADLTKLPEDLALHIFGSDLPECSIIRQGDILKIQIEEHIYSKYWFHKYHAKVFADAMLRAIRRLTAEGLPFSDAEIESDDVHLFVRWTLSEVSTIDSKDLRNNINLAFESVYGGGEADVFFLAEAKGRIRRSSGAAGIYAGKLTVDLAAMADADHQDDQPVVDNFVDNAIVTDADAV